MGAIFDRSRRELAGLVPISFDAPAPDARCPGKDRISKPQLFGLCHTCQRLGGHDMEPAARMSGGLATCLNFAAHGAEQSAPAEPSGVCLSVGGRRYEPENGFCNAGVTPGGVGA